MSLENFEVDALIFRKATQEDLPKIMAFVDIFLRKDWLVRRTYLMTNLQKYDIWLVFDARKLIAWAIAGGKKRTLWNLLVHPKYRGLHIGEILVKKLKPEIIKGGK
jgi:N-acetylglutamate synthase-like GNAT family acetyltransferase